MKHEGKAIIRLNDKTDHGGQVTSASSGTIVMGIEAALHGDMTFCPRCKGRFPIQAAVAGATHDGTPYAYDGDTAACGAKLIPSLPL